VLPDHATPCGIRTHTSAPVPYLFFDSEVAGPGGDYTEAAVAGEVVVPAHTLMERVVAWPARSRGVWHRAQGAVQWSCRPPIWSDRSSNGSLSARGSSVSRSPGGFSP